MKYIKTTIISLMMLFGVTAGVLVPVATSHALDPKASIEGGLNSAGKTNSNSNLRGGIQTVVDILMFVLGAIAVIMIVIGGIRYTTSNGDPSQTKSAKDTILYAVVGIVVALLAFAIVRFVLAQFS